MQMQYKVAGQFEHMYPTTLGDNVKLNSGTTLEQWKRQVEDLLNRVEDGAQTEIWSGKNTLGVTGSGITIGQSLSSSKNGWILVFKPSNSSENINYCYLPRTHESGRGVKFIVGGAGGTIYSKYLLISDTKINGHVSNNTDGNEVIELIKVINY